MQSSENNDIPLLFIHGNGVDHRSLSWLDNCFDVVTGTSPRSWKRLYPDLPGFGNAPALIGDGGLEDMANWLSEYVQREIGERPFGVVGNSMGGLLARSLAAQFPSQIVGMALLAPVIDPLREHRVLPVLEVTSEDKGFVQRMSTNTSVDYSDFLDIQAVVNQQTWDLYRSVILPGIHAVNRSALAKLEEKYTMHPFPEEKTLGALDMPVLIVTGRQDQVVGFEDQMKLLRFYPHATFCVLNGAGHNVHIDQESTVRQLLGEWSAQALRRF